MFTGIVESKGVIEKIVLSGKGARIRVRTEEGFLKDRVRIGDSVATNGVCLTAVVLGDTFYEADLSAESMSVTCFKDYAPGRKVNLELACTANTRLGGHIMQGHVDGIGLVLSKYRSDEAYNVWIRAPENLKRYIAMKGSVAVDGISLTVNEVNDRDFRLTIIPHTLQEVATDFEPGSSVNLEVDVLARYLERLFSCTQENRGKGSVTLDVLAANGFL